MSFQNFVRLSKIKKIPCLIMSRSTKCQLMSYMMIGYDIYDCFTLEHFPFRQSMILTSFFFTRDSTKIVNHTNDSLLLIGQSKLKLI
jgi:hypothetical protein